MGFSKQHSKGRASERVGVTWSSNRARRDILCSLPVGSSFESTDDILRARLPLLERMLGRLVALDGRLRRFGHERRVYGGREEREQGEEGDGEVHGECNRDQRNKLGERRGEW